jgi:FkbM family methyltransferase
MPRLKVQNNFKYYDENNQLIDNKKLERIEQCFVERYIKENDIVLELGARYGTVSCAINNQLKTKTNQVSVEPDHKVWEALEKNKKINNCNFHILRGFLSKKKLDLVIENYSVESEQSSIPSFSLNEIKKMYNLSFNVLVADCEGFLEIFFDENPELYEELNLVIYERDNDNKTGGNRRNCNYNKIENNLKKNGFNIIASHGYGTRDLVWSKNK